jgi:hypothetical protein
VFFMAQDGVRSLQRMQAAAGQWQLSAPLSQPVQRYIDRINWNYASEIVAGSYREFVFFAVPLDSSAVNDAVLVFNTRLGKWMGCWTGWTVSNFVKSRFDGQEVFHFSDNIGQVWYWKHSEAADSAGTYLDDGEPIQSEIWTRSFQFGEPINTKSGYNATLRFSAGYGTATVEALLDLASARKSATQVKADGDILGVDRLPFTLASVKPFKVTVNLRSLPQFYEMYLKIVMTSGWMRMRNLTLSAFPNALEG